MKRILLLTDDMRQGGAERQLSYLAIELKKAGYDVRLLKFYSGENFYGTDLDAHGIVTEICSKARNIWKRPFVIASIARKWKPDLVVAYKDGASMGACLAKLLTSFNLTVSERNTTQRLSSRERVKFRLYSLADHVVPNSFSQSQFISKHAPWLNSRVKVITNMIDTCKFYPDHKESDQSSPLHIITTARVVPQKNILVYLDAIAIVKNARLNVHFDWYGRPEHSDYNAQVMEKVDRLEIGDMITFHGSSKDVASLYRGADAFCLPSAYEGFPNVLCEAMASGLTCIASNVCDNPQILLNGERRFSPSDPEAIASAIEKIVSMTPPQRMEEGNLNRNRIIELCSPDSFLQQYTQLI